MLLEAPNDVKLATTMQALQHSIDGMCVVLSSIFGQGHPMTTYFTAAHHALDICTRELAVQSITYSTLPLDI
jgi:hypothetical protein